MPRAAKPFDFYIRRGDGCWEWTGSRSAGYGTYRSAGRMTKAHRISWVRANGPIPNGLCVLHRCDNPGCVRPDHLFLGTVAENNKDRAAKGRSKGTFRSSATHPAKQRAGELHWRAKLTASDVRRVRAQHKAGRRLIEIAREFQIHNATVSRIVRHLWRSEVA